MSDCLACLRNPAHVLTDNGEPLAEFCEFHWAEFERKLEQVGARYRSQMRRGMHPRIAERRVLLWMARHAGLPDDELAAKA